ncbi:MAG TPA: SDR family oxidoreductase, partial [Candidatus Nitrosopelagicus sp.]|nr:SDR family oxidoreductase [Candidatus Nitrosopelagicus sp.]
GEFNVRVNAICPGSVSGDRMKRVIEAKAKSLGVTEDSLQKDYESMISLKTFVNKEDIANMAVFLLSQEAHKISGQVMTIDGNTERMN